MEVRMIEIQIQNKLLEAIVNGLRSESQPGSAIGKRTAHIEVARNGWGLRHDFQDMMWETDDRADELERHHRAFDCLLQPFQISWMSRYRRPTAKAKQVFGAQAMRAEDLAAWLIAIERLGFGVDPSLLVEELRPKIVRQAFVSDSELSILWYERNRHRQDPIVLRGFGRPNMLDSFVTKTGYLATVAHKDGVPIIFRVDAPKAQSKSMLKFWAIAQLSVDTASPSPRT
jgi:hypothetical protein